MELLPSTARVKPEGLVVAVSGFLLTRYAVVASLRMEVGLLPFLVGEAPFLVIGLGLTVFGVVLTVGPYEPAYVRAVTLWCLAGIAGVGAVVGLAALESMVMPARVGPPLSFIPRILLGGAVGGSLTGVYAARADRQRQSLANRTDRLTVLNRLLRHEVLNKVAVIGGYADLDRPDAGERIRRNADRIEEAINQVGLLAGNGDAVRQVDLTTTARRALSAARERHPDAEFDLVAPDERVTARTTTRLETVLEHLIDNAVEHNEGGTPTVRVRVERNGVDARLVVSDDGAGLPPDGRAVLERRDLPEFDDPSTGFGLVIARLLLEEGGADVDVTVDDGTAIGMRFERTAGEHSGVSIRRLLAAIGASLVAGVAMGAVFWSAANTIPVIGALYGAENFLVGWVTHLFHSVVFGLVFVAIVSHPRVREHVDGVAACAAAGVGYGLVLSVLAAGLVMPLWLRAIGMPAPIPNLNAAGVAAHVLWGVVFGGLFALVPD